MTCMRWIPVLMLMASCSRLAPEQAAEPELEPLAVTRWTGKTELFAEYPPLVLGQTSRFAIHLTRLDSFKALITVRVEVHLSGGSNPAEIFTTDSPSRRSSRSPASFGQPQEVESPCARQQTARPRSCPASSFAFQSRVAAPGR